MSVIAREVLVERVEEYATQHDDPSVAEVLGRFLVDPDGPESAEERRLVEETLSAAVGSDSRRGETGGVRA